MKFYLEKAIFINRAPFDRLELDFSENEIAVLTAINGKGKTTILSHIVDAFHEMARPYFQNEYEGKENKYYRVSSPIYNIDFNKPSFVYLRFKLENENIDYIDIRNQCSEEEYNETINIKNKIPFSSFQNILKENNNVKKISTNFNREKAYKVFVNNLLTYFPSYRYEQPGYLSDPYKISLNFTKETGFSGYLPNPIEVITGLPQLANWIMDIVLDKQLGYQNVDILKQNIDIIITESISAKNYGNLRLGIGPRHFGGARIQIVKKSNNEPIYPTIFNLSSGETSIFTLFGEILRQADNLKNNMKLEEITGIVLIDEIDKHLHIKLQKEVLPRLLQLFSNLQFIISSHSPFLSMGLAERLLDRSKVIDLDNFGISKDPTTNDLYQEVYAMMISENERFKDKFIELETKISKGSKPLIITEGKTDIQYLKKAKEVLDLDDLDIEFYEINESWGDSKLKTLLEQLSKVPQNRKIIGIFDRDVNKIVEDIEKDGQPFKDYGNNVYAFCIPLVNQHIYGDKISIEHYFPKEILKKEYKGRRLFLGDEFHKSGKSKDGKYNTKISQIQNKVEINGIIDEKVFKIDDLEETKNIALSKSDFANLIENNREFINGYDFNNFRLIFDKVKEIIS